MESEFHIKGNVKRYIQPGSYVVSSNLKHVNFSYKTVRKTGSFVAVAFSCVLLLPMDSVPSCRTKMCSNFAVLNLVISSLQISGISSNPDSKLIVEGVTIASEQINKITSHSNIKGTQVCRQGRVVQNVQRGLD